MSSRSQAPNPQQSPDLMTIGEVAGFFRCCEKTVRRLVDAKALDASKVGGQWRISRQEIEAYLDRQSSAKLSSSKHTRNARHRDKRYL